MIRFVFRAAALAATATTAMAAASGPLEVKTGVLVEARRAAADGTVRTDLVRPARVVPGDRVVVQMSYRNLSAQPLGNVVLADAVPHGLLYRGVQPGSPAPEVSVDGQSFASLAQLTVAAPGGARRPAGADDVVAVRWRLPAALAPHAAGAFAFRAELK